jgi:glycosyltransferase involved in cell wall biosynthesis
MKILIISPTQSGIGGTAKHVQGLSNFLKSQNHTVKIISSENTPTIPIKKLKNPSFMLSAFLKTKFNKDFDIVHAHHPIAALSFKGTSAKKVVTFHGIFSKQIEILHGNTAYNLSNKYEQNVLKCADAITAGSRESYDYYSDLGYEIHYIPNAIDTTSLPSGINKKYEKQIIFVGRLSKEKGINSLIQLSQILPKNIHLIIVGSGPLENEIKNIARQHSNIEFLGYLPKNQVIPLLRGSFALIQPSLAEGISSSILEAMACNVPIIASNVGGNKELVINNENGFLIHPDSIDELNQKIILLSNDLNLVKKFGDKSSELIKNFEWSNIGKKYVQLYKSLLGK